MMSPVIFLISLWSLIFFSFAEYLRPGFVVPHMSVYLWLIPLIGSLIGMRMYGHQKKQGVLMRFAFASTICILSPLMAFVSWQEGGAFGEYRILLALIAAILPIVIYSYIKRIYAKG